MVINWNNLDSCTNLYQAALNALLLSKPMICRRRYSFNISFPCGPENVEKLKEAALAATDDRALHV